MMLQYSMSSPPAQAAPCPLPTAFHAVRRMWCFLPAMGSLLGPHPEEMVSQFCGMLPRSLALLVDDTYQATVTEPSVEPGHLPSYCRETANMFASRDHAGVGWRDSLAPQGWPACLTLLCGMLSAYLLPWPGEGTSNAWH